MSIKFSTFFLVSIISILLLTAACTRSTNEGEPEVHTHSEEELYTCPMHPEIRQNKPGSCPICHMKLVKVENKSKTEDKVDIDLNISPYQAELIGIHPSEVLKEEVTYTIPVSGRMLSSGTVALQVFERDLRYIKRGSKFSGQTEVDPEGKITGEIISIDSLADPSSRTIRVIGRVVGSIHKGHTKTLSESSFSGQIEVNLGTKLVIPERAVLLTGRGNFVYIYDGKKLSPQKVILGPKVDEKYVILKGLNEGDKISSGPNFLIDSESKIRGLDDQKNH